MSLRRLWLFQWVFCVALVVVAITAALLTLAGVWPVSAASLLILSGAASAVLVSPRQGRPERPAEPEQRPAT